MNQEDACSIKRWDLLKQQLNNSKPDAFRQLMEKHPDAVLIDVRTPAEFNEYHLPGSLNMDFLGKDYWEIFDQLDKNTPTLVYCRTGRRSVRTVMFMKNGGFTNVHNLDGGLVAWQEHFGVPQAS